MPLRRTELMFHVRHSNPLSRNSQIRVGAIVARGTGRSLQHIRRCRMKSHGPAASSHPDGSLRETQISEQMLLSCFKRSLERTGSGNLLHVSADIFSQSLFMPLVCSPHKTASLSLSFRSNRLESQFPVPFHAV